MRFENSRRLDKRVKWFGNKIMTNIEQCKEVILN